jgi:putative transposase
MRGPQPVAVTLSARQRGLLEQFIRRSTAPQALVQRAQVILAAATGANNEQIAQQAGLTRRTVRRWRTRWATAAPRLAAQEDADASDKPLSALVLALLADAPRPGAPPTFTPEQVVSIVALACEDPAASDQPFSHWTAAALADEAVARGLVPAISPRSVGRFLGSGGSPAAFNTLLAQRQAPAARGI